MKQGLTNFYDLTNLDPLFSAEGLDIDNAIFALDGLLETSSELQNVLRKSLGKTYFLFHPLSETLHPFRFLRNFIESERQRRHFLANPTIEEAKKLIQQYYKTQDSLEKDLKAYRQACFSLQKKTLSNNPSANAYNFYNSKVGFSDFINNIDTMLLNAAKLKNEINSRNKLLLNSTRKTTPVNLVIDKIPQKSKRAQNTKLRQQMAKWITQGWDFTYDFNNRYGEQNVEEHFPIYYELSQFDAKPTTHEFYVGIVKDKSGMQRFMFALILDDSLFLDLKAGRNDDGDTFSFEPLIKKGIHYWYQPATMFYFTPDLTYYPDLATIVDLKRRPYLNEKQVLRQKSSLLDLLLWNGYFHNLSYLRNITARVKAGKRIGSLHYLTIARSYPSLYYLSFNRSVWRLPKKITFLGTHVQNSRGYTNLAKLSRKLKNKDLEKVFKAAIIRAQDIDNYIQNK